MRLPSYYVDIYIWTGTTRRIDEKKTSSTKFLLELSRLPTHPFPDNTSTFYTYLKQPKYIHDVRLHPAISPWKK